jgi:endonuclease-3
MATGRPRSPRGRARVVADRLAVEYPGSATELCALHHTNPYELLTATILSAQTTDERVNMVTPALFAKYPAPRTWRAADPPRSRLVRTTGFFRNKTRSIWRWRPRWSSASARSLQDVRPGHLPGVGRKTASVVRSVALASRAAGRHPMQRLSRRLGLTTETDR